MLGCQAEEARLIASDPVPGETVTVTTTTVGVAVVSDEVTGSCVEYVGVMAMAGDGFALAIFEQAGGAVDGLQRWCEKAASTDPASLRRMGKELTVIQQLAAGAPTTTSTVPASPDTTVPAPTLPPMTLPPPTTAPAVPAAVVILGEGCDPNYTGACVPIAVDVDCAGRGGNGPVYVVGPVRVVGEDIYGLDGDRDRSGCE
jgi:hypothetical protein